MVGEWENISGLDAAGGLPVFLQIARGLTRDILRGRLRPKDRLPGTRSLASKLGVNRNTVVAAYDELLAEGWIESDGTRGTFVAEALPKVRPRRFAPELGPDEPVPDRVGFVLHGPLPSPSPPHPKGALVMAGGVPDVRLVPRAALARAYRRAVTQSHRRLLDYGDPAGHPALRAALAQLLREERALAASPEQVLVTRGAQEALYLAAEVLLAPGDRVVVEAYGYRPAWQALGRKAELVPLPVDREGLDLEALERLLERQRVRAVYLTPHHQYPTMVTLSAARRLRLLALAQKHAFAILEDDYDHEVHYQGRPVLPLASADRAGVVIYVGTLSKVLAPGLRLGYLVAPTPVIARATELRLAIDRQGDLALEAAVASLFEDGEVQRHARRMRRIYQDRREVVAAALEQRLGQVLKVELPAGGMALWLEADPKLDVDRWAARAADLGVIVGPGRRFHFHDGRSRHLRVGYACLDERELVEAVRRLARALPGSPRSGSPRRRVQPTRRSSDGR
ncbi:MAG: PLP-dependent aminotransferase family protein [Deltaproteobacteria bacterium]|nr:PLP-dependent aminotransferase family protein [Deltaproteobacteria bacterium]